MNNLPSQNGTAVNDYPTSDGKPMAETDHHRNMMFRIIELLQYYYADQDDVYVSGNFLLFYEEGSRRHISPDAFIVKGVAKHDRLNYLLWEEGRAPDWIMEITSSSTRHVDTNRKFELYRGRLAVKEYYLFDPFGDHLDPQLQGYRLRAGQYQRIRERDGRLPSQVLGLHVANRRDVVDLYDPIAKANLMTAAERVERAELENARLRAELAALRESND